METATNPSLETVSAAIQELLLGQDSAKKLRDLLCSVSSVDLKPLNEEVDGRGAGWSRRPPATAEDLLGDVIRSLTSTLSMLNRDGFDELSQLPLVSGYNAVKPEESEESSKSSAPRGRRGCYKRKKSSDSWTTMSPDLVDDGHQWRKYGQKSILNTNFPRSYFRCTHKLDQGCQATKQVQKMSDDPPAYRTIYNGKHTCRSLLKPPQIILDDDSIPRGSSILLSFESHRSPGTANARIHSGNIIPSPCSPLPPSTVKCEANVNGSSNQSFSSEYEGFPSPDLTVLESGIGSDQGEALSSSCNFNDDMDLMLDGIDLDDMFDRHFS